MSKGNVGMSCFGNLLSITQLNRPKIRVLLIDVGGSFKNYVKDLANAHFEIPVDDRWSTSPVLSPQFLWQRPKKAKIRHVK